MKHKQKHKFWPMLLLFLGILCIAWYAGSRSQAGLFKGNIHDHGKNGLSIWYDTLKEMDCDIRLYVPEANVEHALHILPASAPVPALKERIEALKAQGQDYALLEFNANFNIGVYSDTMLPSTEFGMVYNGYTLRNSVIPFEKELAAKIMDQIGIFNYETLYYHNDLITISTRPPHFTDIFPLGIKLILLQTILCLMLYFMAYGRIQGYWIVDYEEEERTPAAFLKAVAAYYQRYQCYDQVLGSYWLELTKVLPKNKLDWVYACQEANIPYSEIELLDSLAQDQFKGLGLKGLLRYSARMHQLTLVFRKARLNKWTNNLNHK